jgi:uncharacterized protein YdhG (YjbR/CyaY superfamily)
MTSSAKTPAEYLASLPEDRRKALAAVRKTMRAHLPKGYTETMQYGMPSFVVPLKTYPEGYLGKKDVPLPFAAYASQKNHLAVYLLNVYGDPKLEAWFKAAYAKSGKKLDMGKSCIRFKKLEDLPLDVIGQAVAKTSVADFIKAYEAGRLKRKS